MKTSERSALIEAAKILDTVPVGSTVYSAKLQIRAALILRDFDTPDIDKALEYLFDG
jgi:hypothetical protein